MALDELAGRILDATRRARQGPPVELARALAPDTLAGHTWRPGDRVRDTVTGEEADVVYTTTRHVVLAAANR